MTNSDMLKQRGRARRGTQAAPKLHTARLDGATTIQYELRRSARRTRTINIRVEGDRVVLAVPLRTPLSEVEDIIRRRGENISSQEVENVIKSHPSVLDCAVIAVPSELGEDEVKAYVARRPESGLEPEEVVRWCAENLAYFKVPRYLEMRDELPRTPSLRVRKDLLRQEREDLIEGCFDREAAGIKIR